MYILVTYRTLNIFYGNESLWIRHLFVMSVQTTDNS